MGNEGNATQTPTQEREIKMILDRHRTAKRTSSQNQTDMADPPQKKGKQNETQKTQTPDDIENPAKFLQDLLDETKHRTLTKEKLQSIPKGLRKDTAIDCMANT